MDPQKTGEMIGRMIPMFLGIAACIWVGKRASSAKLRSRRLAGLGLSFGLAVIPLLALATFARGSQFRGLLIGSGGATIVAGIIALWLGINAGAARSREEDEEGGSSGAGALVMGALGLVFGLGMIALPFLTNPPAASPPWTHKIEPHGVEVTLPSNRWQMYDRPGEIAFFGCRTPQMMVAVKEIRVGNVQEDFEHAIAGLKGLTMRNPVTTLDEKRGTNAQGHEHWMFLGEESNEKGRMVVGLSATWWKKTHVVIMSFEGQHKMMSQVGQGEEAQAFRSAATSILGSVK